MFYNIVYVSCVQHSNLASGILYSILITKSLVSICHPRVDPLYPFHPPPPPFPSLNPTVCSLYQCICHFVLVFFFLITLKNIPHMSFETIEYLSFFIRLISLSVTPSRKVILSFSRECSILLTLFVTAVKGHKQ